MKFFLPSLLIVFFLSCNRSTGPDPVLADRIDSLQTKLDESYKPGLGEFMSGIQIHHNKLWFAGENQNWDLADFEIKEIIESIDDIKKYCADRKEVGMISMINSPLDSVNFSIEKKDSALFRRSFISLTNTCNTCHQDNGFGFNKVKIPDQPPFSNQDFK
ncbi:MAG TPA: hypothetical protein VL651_14745 [Bacteroidia bacterium]|jgi:hypothetical protein|nr:hypothetical protein [Bacteroidia bacterium]